MNSVLEKKKTVIWVILAGAIIALALGLAVLLAMLLLQPEDKARDGVVLSQNDTTTTLSQGETTEETQNETTEETQEVDPGLQPNPFKASDFTYKNGRLTCTADTAIFGIDVSGWQGDIDWQKVKNAGVEFAIIRVAGRGYGWGGAIYEDNYAQKNYEGAKAAGIQVGAYFFSQAVNTKEAVEEAEFLLECIKDWELDFPVVYDWEYVSAEARTAYVGPRTLTDCTAAFCETIENAGYEAMIYFNPDQSLKKFYIEELTQYGFWLAMYSNKMNYPFKVDMWQYSNTGWISGIPSTVDLNLYFPYDEE